MPQKWAGAFGQRKRGGLILFFAFDLGLPLSAVLPDSHAIC